MNGSEASNSTEGKCAWELNTNVTDDPYETSVARLEYIFIVCYPILLLICTLGNLFNIAVLRMASTPQGTATFLIALAIGDLLTLWMQLPQYMYIHNPDMFTVNYTYEYVNAYTQGWYIWMQLMWPVFSDWILVAFSVERVRALFDPLSYHGPPAARRARVVIVIILVYAGLCNVYKAVIHYYLLATMDLKTFSEESPKAFIPGLPFWMDRWSTVMAFYKDAEVVLIFAILLICTACIIFIVCRHRRHQLLLRIRATPSSTDRARVRGKTVQFGCIHILLSAVSIYLLCMFPAAVNEILAIVSSYPYCAIHYTYYGLLWRPAQLLMLIPYSVNFYLYLAFCPTYRELAGESLDRMRVTARTRLSKMGLGALCVLCPKVRERAFSSLRMRESAEAPMIILSSDRKRLSATAPDNRVVTLGAPETDSATQVTTIRM